MSNPSTRLRNLFQSIGPGLLFAGAAIGTSHLVLSTRAGAHHGMIFFWIILGAMILKYPFYEFGPRYANATGYSLLKGYKDQGNWAVYVFLAVILIDMFAVVGAIGAVSAGLLHTIFGLTSISVPLLSGIVLAVTVAWLLIGGFDGLDKFIKLISVVLLFTVCIAFGAVLVKGPVPIASDFQAPPILTGAGLALLIGLMGWMPAGMEISAMSSIWTVEKIKTTGYYPNLRESLFDFNLGYVFSLILAWMFLIIGAFTAYGSGQLLEGNATVFTNKLLQIFTANLGDWSYYVIAVASFGTIYGTLVTVLDAFPRCFVRGIRVLRFQTVADNEKQNQFLETAYKVTVIATGLGGFLLFYLSASSMVKMLDYVTIISFLLSPIIAFINLRAIQSKAVPESHRPSKGLLWVAYIGLLFLVTFAIYYLWTLG